jgi:glycosyltransferase involved in cell wall biosynthesis
MNVRRRIAFFNPIFAHYRAALLRELSASQSCEYFFFSDIRDRYGNVPACDLSANPRFRLVPYVRFLGVFAWQKGSLGPALWGDFDAFILEGDAYYLSSWLGALIARLRRRRVIFWSHGWTRADRGLKYFVRSLFYRLADGLLLYGDRAKSIGIQCGFAPERLYVMYNSLDFDYQQKLRAQVSPVEIAALRRELFGSERAPVVIASARLTEKKRFDLLIRALGILNRRGRRVDLLLVGDGPARSSLQSLSLSEGVNVVFAGACYDEPGLARFFACAAVTASPGEVGLTCMHSLGYGVPVITHSDPDRQGPEFEAIVPGVTGDLFAPGDVDDLADTLERWTYSADIAESVRRACLARIETRYHARFQAQAIELALSGGPADVIGDGVLVTPAPRTS